MNSTGSYYIRSFDSSNLGDVERLNLMFYHPTVMKAKKYYRKGYVVKSQEDLQRVDPAMFKSKSTLTRNKQDISLAVIDSVGGVVGWIWFYQDHRHPLPVGVKKNLGLGNKNSHVYQVSYEKLLSEGWPAHILQKTKFVTPEYLNAERKGVIVEGLKIAIAKLRQEFGDLKIGSAKLALYAFIDPNNIASSKVVEKNGFVMINRKYSYDGEKVDLWVRII